MVIASVKLLKYGEIPGDYENSLSGIIIQGIPILIMDILFCAHGIIRIHNFTSTIQSYTFGEFHSLHCTGK